MSIQPQSTADTCRQAVELLPWYLNGTLSPEESQLVAEELASCESCRSHLDELRQVADVMTAHLPTMILAEHALGLPTEMPSQEIEAHLEICPQCRQELAMVQMDTSIEDDPVEASPEETKVVDFDTARRRLADTKPVDRSRWTRFAVAAGVTAALGGSLVMDQWTNPETDTLVEAHEVLPEISVPAQPEEVLFSDGFESGDLGHWKIVVEES